MTTDHRVELKKIKTFYQLVGYLRDEMGWPIETFDFEKLTFKYEPEELGIDAKNAAKIKEIKRLRPLSPQQPWGIFFIEFEPRRLPVVALRRILSQVVLKKRASANPAERKSWAAEDLLFVSNYGEGDERQISFAHFSQNEEKGDLPTLKVLGWDNRDTLLHLDDVAEKLTRDLAWPKDEHNIQNWRQSWRSAFTLRNREVITTSRELSIRLAELARAIRDRIRAVLAIETERGPLTKLMNAFREALIQDLDAEGFADMYAQTITSGLLSARIANPKATTADHLPAQMPVTNPFLKDLMETFLHVGGRRGKAGGPGIDFDELGVSEVVELLDDANMESIVRDFGDKNPQEDPVIHFYELFLKEYDAKMRVQRGEFYTPRPVVSYIVRSVDELLRNEFGLEDGLADVTTWGEMAKRHKELQIPKGVSPDQAFVQILDPATGTGTFLVEIIEVIQRTLVAKWKRQGHEGNKIGRLWNEYVPRYLLPRLHGFELKMAPYAIAHLKIRLKLYETGYNFESDMRVRIFLTNSLEPASDIIQQKITGLSIALSSEAKAVNEIKKKQRFTVVVGNPPYFGESSNNGIWIRQLVRVYYSVDGQPLGEQNPRWLQDDYVKFIRLAEYLISEASVGIMGYITNHSYLDNPTFRGLRRSLQLTFDQSISILDLHGNLKKGEVDSSGQPDKNVFEIQQGVAITLLAKGVGSARRAVRHADITGSREVKYNFLLQHEYNSTRWAEITPVPSFYLFIPQNRINVDEYNRWPLLTEVMPLHSNGIVTARDHLCIQWSREEAWNIVKEFSSLAKEVARSKYDLGPDSRDWQVALAKADLKRDGPRVTELTPILYRPFDVRWTYFTGRSRGFLCMPRAETMKHMLGGSNIALITSRMTKGETFQHAQVSRYPSEAIVMSPKTSNNGFIFPLFLSGEYSAHSSKIDGVDIRKEVNLAPTYRNLLLGKSSQDSPKVSPECIFKYIYAVLHSPSYRNRYAEFLKMDFPHLPLPKNIDLVTDLALLGGELVDLHLMQSRKLNRFITTYTGPRNPVVEQVDWSDGTVWLNNEKTHGFKHVSERIWNFNIGGYKVCEKWLKDRKVAGRKLNKGDIEHYQKIIVALSETIRIMAEIDKVIDKHGGWPGAFVSKVIPDDGHSKNKQTKLL
jgi:predicted helicase